MAVSYNTLSPTPSPPTPARNINPATLGIALVFSLVWPAVLGSILGAICWAWLDFNPFWLKLGFSAGVILGCLASGTTLATSALLWKISAPNSQDMQPATVTVRYEPTKPLESIRVVPLRQYPIMVDQVNGRDLAWFALGLSRGLSHTQRAWLGLIAPSGQLVDVPFWKSLCKPFRRAGLIAGVEPRKAGRVTTRRLDDLLSSLGLDPADPDLWMLGDASELRPIPGLNSE